MAKATAESVAAEPVEAPQTVAEDGQDRFPLGQPKRTEPPQDPQQDDDDFQGDEGEDATESAGSEDDDQPRDEQGRFKPKGQTLRDRLAAEARERIAATQRAERLEAMLAQALGAQGGQPEQSLPQQSGPPNPDDYPAGQFDPAYIQAAMDYRVETALAQREMQAAHARQQEYLVAAEKQYAQAVPDYLEAKGNLLADPMIANHPGIGQAIVASQRPAELIYALGKNPDVAASIARMPPIQAAMALGKVEAYIESQMQQGQQKPSVKPAPPPIKPIGSGARGAGNSDPLKAGSYAEFKRLREEQEAARVGGR